MRTFILLLLIMICNQSFGQEYDKVTFVNNGKDTTYIVPYDSDTKDLINETIVATPPSSTTIIAYPKGKKVSIEQADKKQKVIDNLKTAGVKNVAKIEESEDIKVKPK